MCILSVIPAGVEIPEQDLLNGGIINGDGSGWAIAAGKRIVHGKSMKVEDALEEFVNARNKYPESDAIFHSRWATDGEYGIVNVHPFFVAGSQKTIMAHNGILPCRPKKGDWRSDTRIFADEYLPRKFKRLDKETAFEQMTKYVGTNKIAILTVDPKYKRNLYIVNEKLGHWDSETGLWHSNYDYLGRPKKVIRYATRYRKNDKGVWESQQVSCFYCGTGWVMQNGFCDECGTCEICYEFRDDCACYGGGKYKWNGYVGHNYQKKYDWQKSTIGDYDTANVNKSASDSAVIFQKAIETKAEREESNKRVAQLIADIDANNAKWENDQLVPDEAQTKEG